MNTLDFILLMKEIYGKKLPDLEKIQKKGLLAVKIAQHFALRIDFLDEGVCRHLAKLYRNNLALKPEDTRSLIRSYASRNWIGNFEKFDFEPFASASVGQVHNAKLNNNKEEVVVKIIKGDFAKKFVDDIDRISRFFKFIVFFYPKLNKVFDPIGILENIREYTLEELDLKDEVRGRDRLYKIYLEGRNKYNLDKLAFIEFYEDLSNNNILVSKKIKGKTFDELLEEGRLEYSTLLELFHIHGYYLFAVGIFHGDIHPGNIILGDDNKIYFVDTGAISAVGRRVRVGLFYFFKYLSVYDYESCAFYLNEMAQIKIKGLKFEEFKKDFLNLYSDFTNSTVSQVSLTKKMMETIKLGVNHGMVFERGMFAIIKSLMYLDGMVLRCKPDAILLKDMNKFIKEFEEVIEL